MLKYRAQAILISLMFATMLVIGNELGDREISQDSREEFFKELDNNGNDKITVDEITKVLS